MRGIPVLISTFLCIAATLAASAIQDAYVVVKEETGRLF